MTALMALNWLLPVGIFAGFGSEIQKLLAIAVIGELIKVTISTLLVFPLVFIRAYEKKHSKLDE
jgi:cobalt-zinc-cadmium resistance protein CzcA